MNLLKLFRKFWYFILVIMSKIFCETILIKVIQKNVVSVSNYDWLFYLIWRRRKGEEKNSKTVVEEPSGDLVNNPETVGQYLTL